MASGYPTFVTAVARHVASDDKDQIRERALASARQACDSLKQKLAGRTPRLYYILENMKGHWATNDLFREQLSDAPYVGVANNWDDYSPNDRDSFAEMGEKMSGISITAILGDVDLQAERVETPFDQVDWSWGGGPVYSHFLSQRPLHKEKAAELVGKFRFDPTPGAANVLLVAGQMHTLRHEYVAEGISDVLPAGVDLAGGASADWGAVYFDGQVYESSIVGLRISGQFRTICTGAKGRADAPLRLEELLKEVNAKRRHDEMTAMIFFSCAGGWRHSFEQQGKLLRKHLPEGLGVIGQISGGEFGRLREMSGFAADSRLGVIIAMLPRN